MADGGDNRIILRGLKSKGLRMFVCFVCVLLVLILVYRLCITVWYGILLDFTYTKNTD